MVIVTLIGFFTLLGLSVFQLMLILGMPLGEFAWGGQHRILPPRLRFASVFSIILYIVFAVFLGSKAGIINIIPGSSFLNISMWIFTGYFTLGIVMNAISRSKKERITMTPVALLLAVTFLITTVAPRSF